MIKSPNVKITLSTQCIISLSTSDLSYFLIVQLNDKCSHICFLQLLSDSKLSVIVQTACEYKPVFTQKVCMGCSTRYLHNFVVFSHPSKLRNLLWNKLVCRFTSTELTLLSLPTCVHLLFGGYKKTVFKSTTNLSNLLAAKVNQCRFRRNLSLTNCPKMRCAPPKNSSLIVQS